MSYFSFEFFFIRTCALSHVQPMWYVIWQAEAELNKGNSFSLLRISRGRPDTLFSSDRAVSQSINPLAGSFTVIIFRSTVLFVSRYRSCFLPPAWRHRRQTADFTATGRGTTSCAGQTFRPVRPPTASVLPTSTTSKWTVSETSYLSHISSMHLYLGLSALMSTSFSEISYISVAMVMPFSLHLLYSIFFNAWFHFFVAK